MRTILLAAGAALAALSATVAAQGDAPQDAGTAACYVEISKLMGEPPAGIGEIAAAIRALETALRPQATEINTLKAQLARLEQREVASTPSNSIEAAFVEDDIPQATPPAPGDRSADEVTRVQAEIAAKQAKLRADYMAQQAALLGPVQARISRGAQAFAAASGCPELKMARAPDLAGLTATGARNVTGEFVAWYLANPPA
jgi:Skp family chaperone for outer membrane proteins